KAAPIVGTAIGAHALGRNRGLAAAEAERAQEKQSAAVMDFPMASTGTALDDPQVAVLSPERVDPPVQRKRRLAELLRGSQPSQSSTGQLSPAPRM
ncbi:hypothetical protein EBT31_07605, partial [bacterium]|nr:hypothetical protein [bacterium]